ADDGVRELLAPAEGEHRLRPLPAELRLERAGLVVEAGMDHAAVAPGLVRRDLALLVDHRHPQPRIAARGLHGGGQTHDPGPHNDQIERTCYALSLHDTTRHDRMD